MNFLKVSELEAGKKYKCTLSESIMLVCDVKQEQNKELKEGEDQEYKTVKVGKSCIIREGSKPEFLFAELHDGQMTELTN